jgi:hypothetical protein
MQAANRATRCGVPVEVNDKMLTGSGVVGNWIFAAAAQHPEAFKRFKGIACGSGNGPGGPPGGPTAPGPVNRIKRFAVVGVWTRAAAPCDTEPASEARIAFARRARSALDLARRRR